VWLHLDEIMSVLSMLKLCSISTSDDAHMQMLEIARPRLVGLCYALLFLTGPFNHSLTEVVFNNFKNIGFGSGKNPNSNWFEIYMRFYLWLLFSVGYFFFYTTIGFAAYAFSLSMTVLYATESFGTIFWLDVCRFTFGLAFSCGLYVYLVAQIPYTRNILIQVIGKEYFDLYVGPNPGKEWLKLISTTTLSIMAATTASAMVFNYYHTEHDADLAKRKAQIFVDIMNENKKEFTKDDVKDMLLDQPTTVYSPAHKKG
jgi:hypothetical protein